MENDRDFHRKHTVYTICINDILYIRIVLFERVDQALEVVSTLGEIGIQVKARAGGGEGHDVARLRFGAADRHCLFHGAGMEDLGAALLIGGAAFTAASIFGPVAPIRTSVLTLPTITGPRSSYGIFLSYPPAIRMILRSYRERVPRAVRSAGADGIVVPLHAVQLAHQFGAVLHAAEVAGHHADDVDGDVAPDRADGRQIIFYIDGAGDFDF